MKNLVLTILILCSLSAFGCDCFTPNPTIEFYQAKHVFVGKVIEKEYSSDFKNYTVKFKISKNYKSNDNLDYIKFTFSSEGKYTGEYTSCDWSISHGETWLVYAKEINGKNTFGYYCSNSKPLKNSIISESELMILENGNEIDLNKYTYYQPYPFLEINIDSILKIFNQKEYKPQLTTIILVDIDKQGKLLTANFKKRSMKRELDIIDTIFNMNIEKNKLYHNPKNDFEKDVLKLTRSIKNWKPRINGITDKKVNSRFSILFFVNEFGKIDYQE